MSDLTVNDILKEKNIGSVTPILVNIKNEDIPIIFIKEDIDFIKKISDEAEISIKNSIIEDKKAIIFLIMVKFEKEEYIYDIWFNYGFIWHADFLKKLSLSNRIIIDFRDGDNERIRTIQIENTIEEGINDYIKRCEREVLVKGETAENIIEIERKIKFKCWNDEDVYNLMDKVVDDYPTIEELWENL